MPATLTTIDPILKEVYGPRIEDQLQTEVVALKRVERTSEGLVEGPGGKYCDFPIRVTRNNGIGGRAEGEALPTAGNQGYAQVKIVLKYLYGVINMTGQMMKLATSNKQAFANAADREMEALKDDLVKDTNRMVYSDATGLMASVTTGGVGVAVVTVDNIQYLEIGQIIDILTRSNGASIGATRVISAITPTTYPAGTVTFTGGVVTSTNADGIYRAGAYTAGTSREVNGFANIISASATLHQLTVAAQPKWAANFLGNSGTPRALAEGLMIQMMDLARIASGKRPSAIFTSLGVRRSYFNLLTQQRRFTDVKTFDGGMQGLAFNYGAEVPVVDDVDAPPGKMWFVSEKDLAILQNEDWTWNDTDGSIFSRVSGFDKFEAFISKYWEIGARARNSHGLIADITEG